MAPGAGAFAAGAAGAAGAVVVGGFSGAFHPGAAEPTSARCRSAVTAAVAPPKAASSPSGRPSARFTSPSQATTLRGRSGQPWPPPAPPRGCRASGLGSAASRGRSAPRRPRRGGAGGPTVRGPWPGGGRGGGRGSPWRRARPPEEGRPPRAGGPGGAGAVPAVLRGRGAPEGVAQLRVRPARHGHGRDPVPGVRRGHAAHAAPPSPGGSATASLSQVVGSPEGVAVTHASHQARRAWRRRPPGPPAAARPRPARARPAPAAPPAGPRFRRLRRAPGEARELPLAWGLALIFHFSVSASHTRKMNGMGPGRGDR